MYRNVASRAAPSAYLFADTRPAENALKIVASEASEKPVLSETCKKTSREGTFKFVSAKAAYKREVQTFLKGFFKQCCDDACDAAGASGKAEMPCAR